MTCTPRTMLRRAGLLGVAALLVLPVGATSSLAEAQTAAEGPETSSSAADALAAVDEVDGYKAADYTADSWASFVSARSAAATIEREGKDATARATASAQLRRAADGLVMIRGLKSLVADYETRTPTSYTPSSWAPFAKALTSAADVASDPSVSKSEVAAAKTDLMTGAEELESVSAGTFQTITNNTFWNDTSGNPIYSQGGGVFKFGDTYYWYGVHYRGAELYRANPTRKYDGDVTFLSIPVYSSQDLVNWKFENRVATRTTSAGNGATMGQAGWVGRLGVSYNENTGKYVLHTQAEISSRGGAGVLMLQGDSPTDTFDYGYFQTWVTNSPTQGTGDQTIFTDDDGRDYLIFSNRQGRSRAFVAKLRESDSLRVEPAVQVGYNAAGREGNAMFKLDGKYYYAASDLHGWNTSVNYVRESTSIQSGYSSEYVLAGTEMDYSHVTQTGFFVTVKGTVQDTVIYAGDRWADFAWNGIGYNQWVPITKTGTRPQFHSMSQWQFNATTGEWRVGPQNNYALNPDIQADRIIVGQVRGWTNFRESGPTSIVSNVEPGANGSRFALRVGAGQAFAGGVRQRITVPAGTYRLGTFARTTGSLSAAQLTVTDASGASRTLNIPSSSGWTRRQLPDIRLAAGTATITVRAASGSSGNLFVDQLELVRTDGGDQEPGQRYEAETAPAVCQGTIDSNHPGYSGTGFCNGTNAAGAYAQFTVNRSVAGPATLGVRFANGDSAGRPANVVVNGTTVGTLSFGSTGAWATWSNAALSVSLNAGSNTIRLVPTAAAGLPNVDALDVAAAGG